MSFLSGVLDFLCPDHGYTSWRDTWSSGLILQQGHANKQAPLRNALLGSFVNSFDDDAIARGVVEGTLKIHRTAPSRF